MVITPEYVLSLAQRVKDAKEALAVLEKEWEELFGGITVPSTPAVPQSAPVMPFREREKQPDSIPSLVLKTFSESPTRTFDAGEIAKMFGKPLMSVRKALMKMYSDGKISRADRGKYCAKQDMGAVASKAA